MAGHQIWGPDSLGVLTKTNPTTMQLSSSTITVGGLQFDTSTLTLDLATGIDTGSVSSDTLYYVYSVVNSGILVLKYSLSSSSPTGFSTYRKIGSFRTNDLSQIAGTSVKDEGKVGDIIHSMLTEEQFIAENGAGWILADGRNVSGTKYASIIALSVPDMRGQFLRGKNNGRSDGNEDPAGERVLGNFQNDAFQGHRVSGAQVVNINVGGIYDLNGNASGTVDRLAPLETVHQGFTTDGVNGTPRTANETRVKNLAVNIFVKVEDIVI